MTKDGLLRPLYPVMLELGELSQVDNVCFSCSLHFEILVPITRELKCEYGCSEVEPDTLSCSYLDKLCNTCSFLW